jgi:hypothetical protein
MTVLQSNNLEVRRLEQEKGRQQPSEAKRKTKEYSTQTSSDNSNKDFILNLEKTIEALNSSGKYTLY